MDGKKVVNEYCVCNEKVAPYASDKVEHGGRRFHKKCFTEKVSMNIQREQERLQFVIVYVN